MASAPLSLALGRSEAWPSPAPARALVLLLMAANFMAYVDRGILSLLVEPIKHSLQLSDTQIGLLQGVPFGIFFTLIIFPSGWIADRGNRMRLVGLGVATWGLATAACGLCISFAQLFIARMGVATGEATLTPTGPSLISDVFPPERRTLPIALYSLGATVGSGAALIAGGLIAGVLGGGGTVLVPLLGRFEPWQVTLFVVGVPGVVLSLLFLAAREPARRDAVQFQGTFVEMVATIRDRQDIIAPHFTGVCLYQIYAYAFLAWLPAYFMRVHGWTVADVGLRYGTVHLPCGILGGLMGGALARRLWRHGMPNANLLTTATGFVVMILPAMLGSIVSSAAGSVILLALAMAAAQSGLGPSLAAIQEIVPNRLRGRTTALYYALTATVSVTLGPLVVGLMNDHMFTGSRDIGKSLSFTAAACLPAAAVLLMIAARRRLRVDG